MSASAIWTVHCDECFRWDDSSVRSTRRESEANARRHGWLVQTGPQGGRNLCPGCLARGVTVETLEASR